MLRWRSGTPLGKTTESGKCIKARAGPRAYSLLTEEEGNMRARFCVAALLAAASFSLQAHDDALEIVTLSNRADLVSGGDALLEVRLPKGTSLSRVKLKLNGHTVTSSFRAVPGGRALRGLVSGLVQGRNDFVAEIDERHGHDRREHLVITNHPIGGPVLSGPQITPYFC